MNKQIKVLTAVDTSKKVVGSAVHPYITQLNVKYMVYHIVKVESLGNDEYTLELVGDTSKDNTSRRIETIVSEGIVPDPDKHVYAITYPYPVFSDNSIGEIGILAEIETAKEILTPSVTKVPYPLVSSILEEVKYSLHRVEGTNTIQCTSYIVGERDENHKFTLCTEESSCVLNDEFVESLGNEIAIARCKAATINEIWKLLGFKLFSDNFGVKSASLEGIITKDKSGDDID